MLEPSLVNTYSKSKEILEDYGRFMGKFEKDTSLHVKLEKVNNYINAIVGKYDDMDTNLDHWATRLEFLTNGGGDCEDYAIAKYQTLLDLGVSEEKMGLCVAKDRYSGTMHMVLGVEETSLVYILDNLSFRILPHEKRIDLEFYGCLSVGEKLTMNKTMIWTDGPPKALEKRFKELLDRILKEKMWLNHEVSHR